MSDFNKEPRELEDAELERLLSNHLSQKSVRQLGRLDQRMAPVFADRQKRSAQLSGRFQVRTLRLALSHALVAALFFAAGSALFGERPVETSTGSADLQSQLTQSAPAIMPEQTAVLQFESAIRVAGPANQDPHSLLEQVLNSAEADEQKQLSDQTTTESQPQESAAAAAGSAVPAGDAQTTALFKAFPEPEPLGYAAQLQDGYLYVLTPNSVMRVRLDGAESLLDDLQRPADWRFDGEGNLLVVDQTSEGAVVYKLKRIEPTK